MTRRLASLLLAFCALFGAVTVQQTVAAQPAAADGVIGNGTRGMCDGLASAIGGMASALAADGLCKQLGHATEQEMKKEFSNVWNSLLGDWIKSGEDLVKSMIKSTLTLALNGPSLRLEDTGLFGQNATLAGMLVWLGLVIAAAGFAWQIGKSAITGQAKHVGRAMSGWMQNAVLSAVGLSLVALLLEAGDEITTGLVNTTFGNAGAAYDRILAVMVPQGVQNPALVAGGVCLLLLVGVIQMVLVFLRQSAIPIQCLLLPIAGAGRVGGEATRQWAPRLLTSIMVIIAYKPFLALIICTGFAEFGHSVTVAEWLRGLATLTLGILAPGPLTKVFAPLGAEAGHGMAIGGALGAVAAIGANGFGGRGDGGGSGGGGGGAEPTTPVEHARHVEQTMPYDAGSSDRTGQGSDAIAQASRNQAAAAQVPGQAASADTTGTRPAAGVEEMAGAGAANASGTAASTGAGQAGAAAGGAGLAIQVLDGINSGIQRGANEMGGGGNQ